MIQFYAPEIEKTLTLPESDSAHCTRVLRLTAGDEISVVDGRGHRFRCVITEPHAKHTHIEIAEREDLLKPWKGRVTVAIAPPKNMDRLEWFAEKATEMGIDRIVLLRCRRSERKEVRCDRVEKILVSAMKQSLKGVLPELTPITLLSDFLKEEFGKKYLGYCDADTPRLLFTEEVRPCSDVCVLIGPEGDFSPEEVEMCRKAGYIPVTFGDARLRTETAALFAVAAIHVINQLSSQ